MRAEQSRAEQSRAEQSRAEQSRAEQRNTVIDIIKALGIILMVMGHAGAPITQWIYLFHMSLFFIVSGYCIGGNYSDNFSGLKLFIKKKIKTLYIPCLLFNTSLLILHNLLEYYGAAEPPVRCGESHLSGLTEPPHFVY